jgi:hypothetical protein
VLAAAIDDSASNRDESWALTTALLKGGYDPDVFGGEGQRIGDFVLHRPGPPPLVSSDGRMLTYATTLYAGTANPADATVITLGSGEVRSGVDVPIRFAPTVEVSGVAIGPDGPMKGLTIDLTPSNGATASISGVTPTATGLRSWIESIGYPRAITDANGHFRFLAVSPGSYVLDAAYLVEVPSNSAEPRISLRAWQPLIVGDRGVDGLSITLHSGIQVSGRVEFPGATASPLALVRRLVIGLRPVGASIWRSLQGVVGADAAFTTPGDAPGRYIVFTSNVPGWTLESVSRGGSPTPDDVIDLEAADVTGLVITFSKKTTRVFGSIAGTDGAADPNADVIIFPADTTLWRDGIVNNRRVRMVRATSAATFETSGLAPGEYYIAAVSARLVLDWQDPPFLDRVIPVATRFTLAAGEEKTLPLRTRTVK